MSFILFFSLLDGQKANIIVIFTGIILLHMQLFYYLVLNIQRLTAFPIREAYQNFMIQLKKKKARKQGMLFIVCDMDPCNHLSLINFDFTLE